jgi:hypothetical protein
VIEAPKLELWIVRYELSDFEWAAIKPFLPNKSRGMTQAQRVVLYEEDASDPQGQRYFGVVSWRTETVSSAQSSDVAVRADVKIPDRRITMTWLLRRNIDHACFGETSTTLCRPVTPSK